MSQPFSRVNRQMAWGERTARRVLLSSLALVAAAALVAARAGVATAATFTVGSSGDSPVDVANPCPAGTCTLRGAVIAADEAGGASTIDVPGSLGTYELAVPASSDNDPMPYQPSADPTDDPQSGDLDVDNGASITIADTTPATPIVIDGSTDGYSDRAFHVHAGASLTLGDATLQNFATTGGPDGPPDGGAIDDAGTLDLTDVTLTHNSSQSVGGGIDVTGTLQLNDGVSFGDNSTAGLGGAIYFDENAPEEQVDGASFSGNTASLGGAIYADASGLVLTLEHDSFAGDSSTGPGGAAYVLDGGLTAVSDTFTGEHNAALGGAIDIGQSAPIDVEDSIFDGDHTSGEGGAIFSSSSSTQTPTTIRDSRFEDDTAGGPAGALYLSQAGSVDISGSDFYDDQAGAPGGAIDATNTGALSLEGSTFIDDTTSGGYGGAVSTAQLNASFAGDSFFADSAPQGGAIAQSDGDLAISDSAFHGDSATAGEGGALFREDTGSLTLTSDTFDANTATAAGAAIAIPQTPAAGQSVVLLNDTIARNGSSAGIGAGISNLEHVSSIENTIVADNTPTDCDASAGTSADHGANVDGDGSCFGTGASPDTPEVSSDLITTDPLLAPFATNAGVDIPLVGSPVLGAGIASACPEIDGARAAVCNIGAYQSPADGLSVIADGASSGTVGQPLTFTFTVVNTGGGDAHGVIFTDTLPVGLSYYSASVSQGSCSGTVSISCSLGTVAGTAGGTPGAVTVTITAVPSVAGTFADTGSVSGSEADPSPATSTTITAQVSAPAQSASAQPSGSSVLAQPSGSSVLAPLVLTIPASHVKAKTARLGAIINPAGAMTRYRFQYGRTKRYGKLTAARTLAGAVRTVSAALKRLKPGVRYHFRIEATNSAGTTYGKDLTFRTARAKAKKHQAKKR